MTFLEATQSTLPRLDARRALTELPVAFSEFD